MEMFIVEGGHKLAGSVAISGSKNASLPILIASLLTDKPTVLKNVPHLADTRFLIDLMRGFGAEISFEGNQAGITLKNLKSTLAHYDVVRKMRASILVLAPLLVRQGHAVVSLPGGCAIGTRPVDIHLEGLKALGAQIDVSEGYIHASLPKGHFSGCEFELPLPSVGASENLIMAAVMAQGCTILKKVAREPEVVELCEALNNAGARIRGVGTAILEIEGVPSLNGLCHRIKPDRIEAGTFIALAAATQSDITLKGVDIHDLANVMERFSAAGIGFDVVPSSASLSDMLVQSHHRPRAVDIETAAYPGFPTDMQAQFMAVMAVADGTSTIYERLFENRMMHVPELRRMGAHIEVKGGVATVHGQKALSGAPVMATDLRASASLVVAALCAQGRSEIRRVYHIDRGYESLETKLLGLGARIERCQQI